MPGKDLRINAPVPIDGKKVVLLGSNGKPLAAHHDGASLVITTGANRASPVTSSRDVFAFRVG